MSRLVLKARVIRIAVRFTWPHRLDQLKHLRPLAVVLDAAVRADEFQRLPMVQVVSRNRLQQPVRAIRGSPFWPRETVKKEADGHLEDAGQFE